MMGIHKGRDFLKIPKYWAKEEQEVKASGRKRLLLICWGWSDRSLQSARDRASDRLRTAIAKVLSGSVLERYPYGRGPLREEIIEVIRGKQSEDLAVVTRNAYGALVLNSGNAMFMDVDLPPDTLMTGLLNFFRKLFGRGDKPLENPEMMVLERIEMWVQRQFDISLRIYRTAAGFRCMITSHVYDPVSDATQEMMKSLGCDPLYIRLCKEQGSFRARLTPKPWRINIDKPPWRWPFEDDRQQRESRKWQEKYGRASSAYSVCQFMKALGSGKIHSEIAPVLELHDRMCCSRENKKLA
jgi:hypothetical protein